MAHGILLEAGTNEMELLVFTVAGTSFGINVAKVREIIQRPSTNVIPLTPDAVEGSFLLRDQVLTLVNLGESLGMDAESLDADKGMVIIVELNQTRCGVLVDGVEMIHRKRWEDIDPPSDFLASLGIPLTGITKIEDRVVQILDFETLLGRLLGSEAINPIEATSEDGAAEPKNVRLLVVDDSPTIRDSVVRILELAGYENITVCGDGQEAWEMIEARAGGDELPFDLVLTDIEMPRMDGLHLTARIKEHDDLEAMPVVLFSSLISDENLNKGRKVGANAQVVKFEGQALVTTVEKCLEESRAALSA